MRSFRKHETVIDKQTVNASLKVAAQAGTAIAKDRDIASEVTSQVPADPDPTAPERLRRVDFSVDVYDRGNQYHRFPLLYVEGKGPYASNTKKEEVEAQARDACEIYAKSRRGHHKYQLSLRAWYQRSCFPIWR